MMTKVSAAALCWLVITTAYAKDPPRYPVSDIPEELKKGAYAVVRDDVTSFTILSKNSATLRVLFAVTIFNEKGKRFARKIVGYDNLRKVTSLKAQAFDGNGSVIKRLKSSEITDRSAVDGFYDDARVKLADLTQGIYPYTVEFEYEIAYKFLYHIPGTYIDVYEDVAVQRASYELIFPEALTPRYKTYNVDSEPTVERNKDIISLSWTFENFKARKFEPYSDYMETVTRIEAAPTTFEFEGYAGKMDSWEEYGKWIATLNKGRDVLPEATREKVRSMTRGLPTREEKVRALYDYLQNKTRYVSIQLGIGGYQPFEASVVDKTGYGDCKALSNYMLAMLETAGIKGHYALIMAGPNVPKLEEDFPSSQFNHVIAAVPNGADTLWLECTSQTNPFGYQGRFTGDRKALLITDNGGIVANTQRYPADVNVQTTTAEVTVLPTGQATASFSRTYSGLQYENGQLHHFINSDLNKQKKWVERHIEIPSFSLQSFSIRDDKQKIPSAIVSADLQMNRFATVSGKRMFLTPNLMNRSTTAPERLEKRNSNIFQKMGFIDVDTIRYKLPEDIYPEFLPEDVSIVSQFGEYSASFKIEQGKLVYVRKMTMRKGEFPASTYQELIDFFRNINKADHTKMVFMTKT